MFAPSFGEPFVVGMVSPQALQFSASAIFPLWDLLQFAPGICHTKHSKPLSTLFACLVCTWGGSVGRFQPSPSSTTQPSCFYLLGAGFPSWLLSGFSSKLLPNVLSSQSTGTKLDAEPELRPLCSRRMRRCVFAAALPACTSSQTSLLTWGTCI